MAKIFFHIAKEVDKVFNYELLLRKLNPVRESENKLKKIERITIGISSFNDSIIFKDDYLALGCYKELPPETSKFFSKIPDGVSALIRFDNHNNLEILPNKLASRTIWYYLDDKDFIVSTSQRAIINIIGNYSHNEQATSWFLSAGNLGPGTSWDSRIKHLNYNQTIFFDFNKWQIKIDEKEHMVVFNQFDNDASEFRKVLIQNFDEIKLPNVKWGLTLSGGYDSRLVLKSLVERGFDIEAITWGIPKSLNQKDTDGFIAERVAEDIGVPFHFFDVSSCNNFDDFLTNYVSFGEARIDHMANYLDNFEMWFKLKELGFNGIIRSDEVFGWKPVVHERNVRLLMEMTNFSDFDNFKGNDFFDLPFNGIPDYLTRRENETLYSWRDRLFNIYRQTFIQTALHDLFYPFMEMINPLYSNEIVESSRRFNDYERTEKALYIKAISSLITKQPIARRPSYPSRENVLSSSNAVEYLNQILSDEVTRKYVPQELLSVVNNNLFISSNASPENRSYLKYLVSSVTPVLIKKAFRKNIAKFNLDYNLLAFRIAVINTWIKMINDDLDNNLYES